jgi:hypothetical protein
VERRKAGKTSEKQREQERMNRGGQAGEERTGCPPTLLIFQSSSSASFTNPSTSPRIVASLSLAHVDRLTLLAVSSSSERVAGSNALSSWRERKAA